MSIRLMIVEDDPMVMDIHKQFIAKTGGFEIVSCVGSGLEAIKCVQELSPHVILLDIYLPDKDGISTLKELRSLEVPADVILITAARDSMTIKDAFRYGAIDYIIKPFKYERLKAALETYQKFFMAFGSKDSFSQEEIDTLNSYSFEKPSKYTTKGFDDITDLPKGLNELTLRQIVMFLLKQTEAKSAEEVAEGIGLARVTARRYLEFLETINKVELEVQYGSVGRPVNRYRPLK